MTRHLLWSRHGACSCCSSRRSDAMKAALSASFLSSQRPSYRTWILFTISARCARLLPVDTMQEIAGCQLARLVANVSYVHSTYGVLLKVLAPTYGRVSVSELKQTTIFQSSQISQICQNLISINLAHIVRNIISLR